MADLRFFAVKNVLGDDLEGFFRAICAPNNELGRMGTHYYTKETMGVIHPQFIKILQAAEKMVPELAEATHYEIWSNHKRALHAYRWHIDQCEPYTVATGAQKLPIFSLVYYCIVDKNMLGGEFVSPNIKYLPENDTLFGFEPGVVHSCSPYEGMRMAIAINSFKFTPEEKEKIDSVVNKDLPAYHTTDWTKKF